MRRLFLLAGLSLLTSPALAADEITKCIDQHHQCVQTCLDQDKLGAKATCVAKCAGIEAQCAGQVGIEQSEPYIREKAQQLEGILKDLLDNLLPQPPKSTPAPKPPLPPQET